MSFVISNLKKLIYDKLKDDSALVTLLGGTANIFHFHPKQESNIPYPIIVYHILGIEDGVYDIDNDIDVNRLTLNIDVFSSNSTMTEADNLADRLYALLHRQNLSDSNIIAYSCFRKFQDENCEESSQCWRINARYELTNASK